MAARGRFQCLGGPFDGDSPPWADGRYEIRYPLPPTLPVMADEQWIADADLCVARYILAQRSDGGLVYLYEPLRRR